MKPSSRKLVTVLGATLAALALAELGLRAFDLPRFPEPRINEFSAGLDFYAGPGEPPLPMHRIQPNSDYRQVYSSNPRGTFDARNSIRIRANARGFRGPACSGPRVQGGLRIAFLGDSFTLGEGVRADDTLPARSAYHLAREAGNAWHTIEAFNFGMLAFNTEQEEVLLHQEVLPCEPDLVVLGYFLNDAAPPYFTIDTVSGAVSQQALDPIWFDSPRPPAGGPFATRLGQALWSLTNARRRRGRTIEHYEALFADDAEGWVRNRASLERIVESCEALRLPLVVVCFPVLMDLDEGYPFAHLHERVAAVVRGAGGPSTRFLDLLPVLRGRSAEELWVHPGDHHPNELALDLAARALAEALLAPPALLRRGR